ncbi:MAG: hypothetical protein ACFCBW_21165 [Candidatus Competibacterales bacterium]
MTIGIAVSGPRAGLAVYRALQAVERIGRGAIGGFVSFAALDQRGQLLRAETQRGGTTTLFTDGEFTGVDPPEIIAGAPRAVLMSSGPDRPDPLSQFTPGLAGVGLVTGHRLPNMTGAAGVALNQALLARLAAGESSAHAVAAELAANPKLDAGLVAIDAHGRIALGDTALVQNRDDRGSAWVVDEATGLAVGVLHNAIFPFGALAAVAIHAAMDAVDPQDHFDHQVALTAGTTLQLGTENRLDLDCNGEVMALQVTDPAWLSARWDGAVLPRGAKVYRNGAPVAKVVLEPYGVAQQGRLVSLSGRPEALLCLRQLPPRKP